MKLLEKENWWVWLLLTFMTSGNSVFVIAALLNVYDADAWYARWLTKWPKWLVGIGIALIVLVLLLSSFSFFFLMFLEIEQIGVLEILLGCVFLIYLGIAFALLIFQIQILATVNAKLNTPGSEIYLSPYIWILGLIVPIVGWILLVVMYLYLQIWYLVMLRRGEGVK